MRSPTTSPAVLLPPAIHASIRAAPTSSMRPSSTPTVCRPSRTTSRSSSASGRERETTALTARPTSTAPRATATTRRCSWSPSAPSATRSSRTPTRPMPPTSGASLAQSFDPSRTMLGRPQLERLEHDLLEADKDGVLWKFVMVPEPIQNLGPLAAADRYEGYAAERNELLKFIDDHDIDNVVFVTADIHGTLVNNLTYQTSLGGPQIALDAWEISTGAVAFSPTLGPTVVGAALAGGFLPPAQAAFCATLPVANDADRVANAKDDFLKALINGQLDQFGYDRLGLNDNLASADGLVDAKLLQGDYVAAHTFGWTQFDIDPQTHALRVTTYGVPSYTEAEAAADPEGIAARTPVIVRQFEVAPAQTLKGGRKDDMIAGGDGDDKITGDGGDDTLLGKAGDDVIDGGKGKIGRASCRERG